MTPHEKHLWYDFPKYCPVTVKSQKIIGNYIVDFYIAKAKLVIELDGSQHWEEEHQARDEKRDAELAGMGLTVFRYSNKDIDENFDGICQDIANHLSKFDIKIDL